MGAAPDKCVSIYGDDLAELWAAADQTARRRHNAPDASNGAVLAQICAAYLDTPGPLENTNKEVK